jgi:hypothetical protein
MFFTVPFGSGCSYDTSSSVTSTQAASFDVVGDRLYLTGGTDDNLKIYSIASPTTITLLGTGTSASTNPNLQRIKVRGNYAYICYTATSELGIWDISDPTAPTEVAVLTVEDPPTDVALIGNYACVTMAASPRGAQVYDAQKIDISDPQNPSIVDNVILNAASNANSVAAYGNTFLIAAHTGGSYVYTVDATTFNTQDSLTFAASAQGIGHLAINTAGTVAYSFLPADGQLVIIDITDPTNLSQHSRTGGIMGTSGGTQPLDYRASSQTLYLGSYQSGGTNIVHVIDVSDPSTPVGVDTISSGTDGISQIKVLENACSSLVFSTWTAPKLYLIGTPAT